jgi:hypothetical protein
VSKDVHSVPSGWPAVGGEMGARIRAFDWERSPLGPISSWSQSLKSTVDLMMASQLAMNLIWGPELVMSAAFWGVEAKGHIRADWCTVRAP